MNGKMVDGVTIRSAELDAVEVSWFSALCADDYEFLGVPDGKLRSSWEHCRDIVLTADRLGYNNILLPNGYVPGQDTLTSAVEQADAGDIIELAPGDYIVTKILVIDHPLTVRGSASRCMNGSSFACSSSVGVWIAPRYCRELLCR